MGVEQLLSLTVKALPAASVPLYSIVFVLSHVKGQTGGTSLHKVFQVSSKQPQTCSVCLHVLVSSSHVPLSGRKSHLLLVRTCVFSIATKHCASLAQRSVTPPACENTQHTGRSRCGSSHHLTRQLPAGWQQGDFITQKSFLCVYMCVCTINPKRE